MAKQHKSEKIITAHHQDDLLETMLLNLLRGTGPRGLNPMTNSRDIIRPLLSKSKQEIIDYAHKHNLSWHEDSTNSDTRYLRNYIRLHILPLIDREKLLKINNDVAQYYLEIDHLLLPFLPRRNMLKRTKFSSLPFIVQKEVMRRCCDYMQIKHPSSKLIVKMTEYAKTMQIGKRTDIDGNWWMISTREGVMFEKK